MRSSCEAVATNERRAASWRRSSRCMRGQRAGEVADLVEAVVARGRGVGPLLGHAHRGGAQAREAAADAGRQADAEQDRDEQPDRGGGEEGVAHLADRGVDVGERLQRDEHEVAGEVGVSRMQRVERDVVGHVDGLRRR